MKLCEPILLIVLVCPPALRGADLFIDEGISLHSNEFLPDSVFVLETSFPSGGSHALHFTVDDTMLIGGIVTAGGKACWFKAKEGDTFTTEDVVDARVDGFSGDIEDFLMSADMGQFFYLGLAVLGFDSSVDALGWAKFLLNQEEDDLSLVSSAVAYGSEGIIVGTTTLLPLPLVGDCNGDGVLDTADLDCITSVEDRDAVLEVLNTLPGDLDGNGDVAFADFLVLSANFGQDPSSYAEGNIDLIDGIEFADFLILSNNFGKTPADVAAVPEPSGLMIASMGLLCCMLLCRRSHRGRVVSVVALS